MEHETTETPLEGIGKRLRKYLKIKNIGINEIGRLSGTSGGQISFMLQGRRYSIKRLLNIFACCSDLNSDWLLFGKGDMIQAVSSGKEKEPDEAKKYRQTRHIDSLRDELALLQKAHIDLLENHGKLLESISNRDA